jgi:hypothetical protein
MKPMEMFEPESESKPEKASSEGQNRQSRRDFLKKLVRFSAGLGLIGLLDPGLLPGVKNEAKAQDSAGDVARKTGNAALKELLSREERYKTYAEQMSRSLSLNNGDPVMAAWDVLYLNFIDLEARHASKSKIRENIRDILGTLIRIITDEDRISYIKLDSLIGMMQVDKEKFRSKIPEGEQLDEIMDIVNEYGDSVSKLADYERRRGE